jgi:large conductance mechanosensitive channel
MTKDKIVTNARGFFAEFRNFAVKGNALELAVAVVVGTAFTGIVTSLVGDIIMPVIGFLTNNVDLKMLAFTPRPEVVIKYGAFLQAVVNFLLVSISIFLVFKVFSAMRRRVFAKEAEKEVPAYEKPPQERLLEEIRDLLKQGKSDSV